MGRDKLSALKVKNLSPTEKDQWVCDGQGLYLMVRSLKNGGGKSWLIRMNIQKVQYKKVLGTYPLVSLQEARELAFECRKDVEKNGTGYFSAKLPPSESTVEDIWKKWKESVGKNKSQQRLLKIEQTVKKHVLSSIGSMRLSDVTPLSIVELLQRVELSGTYIVKNVHQYLKWMFEFAFSIGMIEQIPITDAHLNLVKKHHRTNFRCMNWSQVPEFLVDLEEYRGFPITKYAMKFILLTGIRTKELRQLQWVWVDWENNLIRIPPEAYKQGLRKINSGEAADPFYVLLSGTAKQTLERAKRISGNGRYIFPSPYTPAGRNEVMASDAIINKSLERMGWAGQHVGHGFRSLFVSRMTDLGAQKLILDLCQSRREADPYLRDTHLKFWAERRQVMEQWATELHKIGLNS